MLFSIYIFITFQRVFSSYDSNGLDFIVNRKHRMNRSNRCTETTTKPFLLSFSLSNTRGNRSCNNNPREKKGRERKEKCQRGLETIKSLPMTVSLSFLLARGVVYLRARSSIVFIPVYDGVGLYFQKNHRFLPANVYADT